MFNKELVGRIYQEAGIFAPAWLGLINHMLGVSHVAGLIARRLVAAGRKVNVELVETAAAVHDVGKVFDGTLWGHVEKGVKFLQNQGVDERVVHLVQIHQMWKGEVRRLLTTKEKIIVLADLSFGNKEMRVKERVEEIIVRYGGRPNGIPQGEEKWIRKLSREICQEFSESLPF